MATTNTKKNATSTKPAKKRTPRKAKADGKPDPASATPATKPAKQSKRATTKRAVTAPPKSKRPPRANSKEGMSAIDAAAQVLGKAKQPMRAGELIQQMEAQGLWTSPDGKTPASTLYSAIMREINLKGSEARFAKVERGMFAAR